MTALECVSVRGRFVPAETENAGRRDVYKRQAQILQVERAEEFGAFRRPEGSEQIAQVSDRLESSRLRQKLARADQLGEARVPSAQEIDDGVDRGRIARPHGLDALQILVFARNPQIENPFEKIPRKHGPDQFDRQVGLSDVEPPAPEVAAQVSGGRDVYKRQVLVCPFPISLIFLWVSRNRPAEMWITGPNRVDK